MKKIIIAGSTGYLGSHLVKELQAQNTNFQALARSEKKLLKLGLSAAQIIQAEVTKPESLSGKLNGADVIISTIGITHQKDGLSYMDVDYQANLNLLHEAQKAGIKKFVYVSVIHGDQMRHLKITAAKERFVDALKSSGMDYLIVRPNGFFSDLSDFLKMAKRGRVYLFGDGEFKLNPIHGADLAKGILDNIANKRQELIIGGPDILTQNEVAVLALESLNQTIRITHLPHWIRKLITGLLRTFTSSITYGPIEFFLEMSSQDNIAPRYGVNRLKNYFRAEADRLV